MRRGNSAARRRLARQLADLEFGGAQHVHHQHGVVGHGGPAGLRDDGRVRHALRVADLHDAGDDVVRVLLEGVVERRGEVRLRAVVVHAQAAAHVQEAQRRAHLHQVGVDLGRLAQTVLDRADGGDLAAEVEVEQLEGVEEAVLPQVGHGVEEVAAGEAELRAVAARGLPVPGAPGGEARADTDAGAHPHLLGDLPDQRQLGRLLHDQDDVAAELRGEEGRLDIFLVLVAVADDQGLLVLQHGHDGQQLGLRAGLEPVVVGAAVLHQPLHQVAVLVDLDGIDPAVGTLVAVLGDGAAEGLVQLHDPGLDDLRETDQQRQADAALPHLVHQLLEIDDRRAVTARMDDHVAMGIDGEIVVPPTPDVVEVEGIGRSPAAAQWGVGHLGAEAPLSTLERGKRYSVLALGFCFAGWAHPGRGDFNTNRRGGLPAATPPQERGRG